MISLVVGPNHQRLVLWNNLHHFKVTSWFSRQPEQLGIKYQSQPGQWIGHKKRHAVPSEVGKKALLTDGETCEQLFFISQVIFH